MGVGSNQSRTTAQSVQWPSAYYHYHYHYQGLAEITIVVITIITRFDYVRNSPIMVPMLFVSPCLWMDMGEL